MSGHPLFKVSNVKVGQPPKPESSEYGFAKRNVSDLLSLILISFSCLKFSEKTSKKNWQISALESKKEVSFSKKIIYVWLCGLFNVLKTNWVSAFTLWFEIF